MGTVPVKIIAITQPHRGHGVSTAAFFLGRALVQQHVPVLLGDLTGRHTRVTYLNDHFPTKKLVTWFPPTQTQRDLPGLLRQARAEVAGKAACILLDVDQIALEGYAEDFSRVGVDYLIIASEFTAEGQKATDRLALRYGDLVDRERAGVAFARVSNEEIAELPQRTDGGLPVLGHWPADYRLATSDDDLAAGALPAEPHQPYLAAISLLATRLIRLVPLARIERAAPDSGS
jgi:hypothetical protein